ncbi:DUF6882 domain-containing protein [Loktanella sp. S4079]|uniref:DUF6882 domain-containing protein n=1 Tax=Loktanella sp. S4079 TaxID=579483 RepID=UPI0005FA5618|nr:DUF6882 domain-containing protein [Loktanella sp. S4079]KJZ18867.1 hypothetical protein TW80_12365 [Loktanella sp. S4079]
MFGWFKKKNNSTSDTYDGEGIFIKCEGCENYHRAPDLPDFDDALKAACAQLSESSQRLYETFKIRGHDGRWNVLPEEGTFYFTNSDGRRCFADFSLVGSWIEQTHSWMWGWGLPDTHITDANRKAPDLARAKGIENDWPCLTTAMLLLNDHEAWHLTEYAASLAQYPMVYRAKVNEKAWSFFAIDTPVWET